MASGSALSAILDGNDPVRKKAFAARSDRLKIDKETLSLAHRLRSLESEVRTKHHLQIDAIVDADKRVTELQWEVQALQARDEKTQVRLDAIRDAILEKKKLVNKEFQKIAPEQRPARKAMQFFRLVPTEEHSKKEAPTEDPSKQPQSRQNSLNKPRVCSDAQNWQDEIRKRADERQTHKSRVQSRAEELRLQMRATVGAANVMGLTPRGREKYGAASSLPPSSLLVPSALSSPASVKSPKTPRITREAWLRAYAEDKNTDLEQRLFDKEEELRQLEVGILKNRTLLEERAKLADKNSAELGLDGRPTHRNHREAREKNYIVGTKECDYLQEALGCIHPLEDIREEVSSVAGRTAGSLMISSSA